MLIPALIVCQTGPTQADLQSLVKAKDVAALTKLVSIPSGTLNPFNVLRTNGAYETGKLGWKVESLDFGKKHFFVLTTKLTSEDIGDILLEKGDGLTYVPETEDFGVKIDRHQFEVHFNVPQKSAQISDNLDLDSENRPDPIFFRLSSQYRVSSIVEDGKPVDFAQAGGVVAMTRIPGKAVYKIEYAGVVDMPQYAGTIGPHEATLTNDYWYPLIARQPAPYSITVYAPGNWTVVAQGEMQIGRRSSMSTVVNFRMDLPVTYYSLSVGPYKSAKETINGRDFIAWSPRLSAEDLDIQAKLYAPINKFYSDSFGEYPFKQWGALDSPGYGGGALEAYSYATYGGGMPDEDAHEPSHTWWGGILVNTYLHSFWNESFADFSDQLYRRNVPIGNHAERALAFIPQDGGEAAYNERQIEGASAFAGPVASSLGYGKGAAVLAMLEQLIGTEKMIATMREWVREDHGKAVDWPDFERVAIKTNPDRRLESFFADWLRKPGFADLHIEDVKKTGTRLSFRVGFGNSGSFRIPLEVLTQSPNGQRQTTTVDVKGPGVFTIDVAQDANLASFDPWLRLLRKFGDGERTPNLTGTLEQMNRVNDPKHADFLRGVGQDARTSLPKDLDNCFLVGMPDSMPQMAALCKQVGFRVEGDHLTYKGTTIDLHDGGAMALVDLPNGKRCAIGLGKIAVHPVTGLARIALVDGFGRFLRGESQPKTSGPLTFKLGG